MIYAILFILTLKSTPYNLENISKIEQIRIVLFQAEKRLWDTEKTPIMKQVFLRRFADLKFYLSLFILSIVFQFCSSENNSNKLEEEGPLFRVEGTQILKDNLPVFYKGLNALQTYGLSNADLMDQWNIEIVREFIGNLREQPIDGGGNSRQ